MYANDNFRVFTSINSRCDFGKSSRLRVTSVIDCDDIDLVLKQSLVSSIFKTMVDSSTIADIKICILNYVKWFNNNIYTRPMPTCADVIMSLYDVLARVRFIIDTNSKLSLMHLDGLC